MTHDGVIVATESKRRGQQEAMLLRQLGRQFLVVVEEAVFVPAKTMQRNHERRRPGC